ncbi:MAG: PilZ domain-containing protein [Bdellovibrionales bacterium]|nr:PilZ domain-containing protein [Bdellovibrionales bacterium]
MRAKVKIINQENGEEFLFLVSKMNLKGLLVSTSQTIKPKTKVKLQLMLGPEFGNTSLGGIVHKISKDGDRRGIVVAFDRPSRDTLSLIQDFVEAAKSNRNKSSKEQPKKEKKAPKIEKTQVRPKENPTTDKEEKEPQDTQIVDNDTLPTLSLRSPDNTGEISFHTMDEEAVQAEHEGLAGNTTHFNLDEKDQRSFTKTQARTHRSPFFKASLFVLILLVTVVGTRFALDFLGIKIQVKELLSVSEKESTKTNIQKNAATEINGDLIEDIVIDDQGGFIKIGIVGKGSFVENNIEKISDNGSVLKISLPKINQSTANASYFVENDPISSVEVSTENGFVEIYIRFSKTFPRFEVKPYRSGIDAFFHRE